MRKPLERCPSCSGQLDITEMECRQCQTQVRSRYEACPFCRLSPEASELLRVFVLSRGNMKDVERELGITYSQARTRLDGLIREMGYRPEALRSLGALPDTRAVLDALARGEVTAAEARAMLDRRSRG